MDRFAHVIVHARRQTQLAVALHRVGRHRDDPRSPVSGPASGDLPRGFEPVHLWHLDVHQHEIVRLPLDGLDGFETVGRDVGAVSHLLEQAERQLLVHDIVLGHEDPQGMAARHLGIELEPGRRPLVHADRLARENPDERIEQLRRLDRLRQVRREPHVLGAGLAATERGEEQQGQCRRGALLADRPRQGDAVQLGHVHVEDPGVE